MGKQGASDLVYVEHGAEMRFVTADIWR
jgi:hypothetical protein